MNSNIYDHFLENFGSLENTDSLLFVGKYNECLIAMLKSTLKILNRSKSNMVEIKHVARAYVYDCVLII